jgi:hypothetical protein
METTILKGTKVLENLSKTEVSEAMNDMTFPFVAEKYGVSVSSARRILNRKSKEYKTIIIPKRKDGLHYKPENVPFSNNEDDYGKSNRNTLLISSLGIICFKGNSVIKEKLSEISQIVKHYKFTMKINNIALRKIPHYKFVRYE